MENAQESLKEGRSREGVSCVCALQKKKEEEEAKEEEQEYCTMRKKVDARIRTLVENGVKTRQRSMFVIVGDKGRDQVS